MNSCTFIGRITKDPALQIKTVKGVQTPVLNFVIAVDDGFYRDQNGDKTGTEFIKVTAWRGQAEAIARNMAKGRQIAIKGAVHLDKWQDNEGNWRYGMAVPYIEGFEFQGPKPGQTAPAPAEEPVAEEEFPFD